MRASAKGNCESCERRRVLTRFGVCEHCLREMNNFPLLFNGNVFEVPASRVMVNLTASHRLGDVVNDGEPEDIAGLYGEGLNDGR